MSAPLPLYPVILSGGVGSRLWPLSRECYPKQFLDVAASGQTLVQETLGRLAGLDELQPPLVVCNEAHRFLVPSSCATTLSARRVSCWSR